MAHRSWIFPTDPDFLAKAGRVLDLYQGRLQGRLLHPGEFVICADEKPSIQARAAHPRDAAAGRRLARAAGRAHLQARRRAHLPGRLDIGRRGGDARSSDAPSPEAGSRRSTGSRPGDEQTALRLRPTGLLDRRQRLLHRGKKSVKRLERRWRNLTLIHLPLHASWLNQIEMHFSIIQRKLLTPNDFDNLATSPAP